MITGTQSRRAERAFVWAGRLAVALPLAMVGVLLADLVAGAIGLIDWEFLTGLPGGDAPAAGIGRAAVGSALLVVLTAAIAIPIGVATAVYLQEYGSHNRLGQILEVVIANLAGVPPVIYGLIGLGLFVRIAGVQSGLIAGALTLSLLVLPIAIIASREALRSVPDSVREAAIALGASRWRTVRQVVIPQALPGILTGIIFSIARAFGETAPLLVLGAVLFSSASPPAGTGEIHALPVQIYHWITGSDPGFAANALAAIIVLLVTLSLLTSVAMFLRARCDTGRGP